ncbi:rhomboid family intramembrane serine protease [Oceanobacillus iheyensis]|uniref:Hypothetical conserved protein n=1 Tax=Oceanobacillus iheyensis (strain DSM 14371 / CIP 107618 / JCM 11309 / KCTC 3954 / HTE831) TaxID=221109 RepID=Q8EQ06_OCEIH|nr:rhomboid family intramembrane serine protease [Oceanobacillus iheyensis]BAC13879.1 hypothetical conserved protein [Oceanobacillus iheyensis HTE831]
MYINDVYVEYQLAYQLLEQGFELINKNEETDELWFEKFKNNTSVIIRLIPKRFDWDNQLKQDVTNTYQRIHQMRKMFKGKHIEAITIYTSSEEPIGDDWQTLKKPITSNAKKPFTMNVYFLHESTFSDEIERLREKIGLDLSMDELNELDDEQKESKVNYFKQTIFHDYNNRIEKRRKVFSNGKPLFTYILIALNLFFFLQQINNGGSENIDTLIQMGAKYNPLIMEGEWWRLLTSMFLHIGFVHILMNMVALFYLGTAVERIFGRTRFLVIYFLGGIAGSIASFATSISISAGASGAIFGLFGALLFFGLIYKDVFKDTMGMNIVFILVVNLVIGFSIPEIDMGAHLGGLLGGFLIAACLYVPGKKNGKYQLGAIIAFIILCSGLLMYGFDNNASSLEFKLIEVEEKLSDNQFEEAIDLSTNALNELKSTNDNELVPYFLFHRSYAYLQQDEIELAQADLEESLNYDETIPEAYNNLTIIYANNFEFDKANEIIDEGLERFPENQELLDLQQDLSNY